MILLAALAISHLGFVDTGIPDLGPNANMHGFRPFPANDPWNTPVDTADVDPNSAVLIAHMNPTASLHPDFGANFNGGPFGIPYVVGAQRQTFPMTFDYADQSDPGPYPFPKNAPIEGGFFSTGDRHVLCVDWPRLTLWETWDSHFLDTSWHCGSGAKFNLITNTIRPAGWTSADAAGLPIFPGLVRYDEVYIQGSINHALRFTVNHTRHAYVAPARHYASSITDPSYPPMGMRVRLKANVDISGYPADCQVILRALKKYGMMVADNGGDWFLSGAPDARWSDNNMNLLKQLKGNQFEVVKMGQITTN